MWHGYGDRIEALRQVALRYDLLLIALFGSRAKKRSRESSDVDLAVLARNPLWDDPDWLSNIEADLSLTFSGHEVDAGLLNGASPLFMFEVARTGRALFEAQPDSFSRFKTHAALMYYDNEPRMLRQAEYLKRSTA